MSLTSSIIRPTTGPLVRGVTEAPFWGGGLLTPDVLWALDEGAKNLLAWSEDFTQGKNLNNLTSTEISDKPEGVGVERSWKVGAVNGATGYYAEVQPQLEGMRGKKVTVSAFLKADEEDKAVFNQYQYGSSNASVVIDLTNGTFSFTDPAIPAEGIIDVGNGWYRAWYSFDVTTENVNRTRLWVGGISINYSLPAGHGIKMTGWQVEEGYGPPSDYHKTTDRDTLPAIIGGSQYDMQLGSAAGADTNDPTWEPTIGLTGDGTDDYAQLQAADLTQRDQFTWVVRFKGDSADTEDFGTIMAVGDANLDPAFALGRVSDTTGVELSFSTSGGPNQKVSLGNLWDDTFHVVAFAYDAGTIRYSVDGGSTGTGSISAGNGLASANSLITLFAGNTGAKNTAIVTDTHAETYNRALSDAELQEASQRIIDNPDTP